MKKTIYKQCSLQHPNGRGHVTWIPTEFAIMGEVLKIKKDDDTWDNGYVVENIGNEATSEEVFKKK